MSEFNGMTEVELEMLKDRIEKNMPMLKSTAPKFADLAVTYYEEYKKYESLSENERVKMAVSSAHKYFGG